MQSFYYFRYKNLGYASDNESLVIKEGGLNVWETTIPLNRIQHIDIEQTYISRIFNLYELNIYTAGDSHSLGFIRQKEADILKESVLTAIGNEGDADEY